jgi:hypothetical protein
MGRTRKAFLGAASVAGISLLISSKAAAQSPSPTPTATPAPSPAARAFALRMRRFDPHLTDAQIDEIAQNIDQDYAFGSDLRSKTSVLHNGDAPTPEFRVLG